MRSFLKRALLIAITFHGIASLVSAAESAAPSKVPLPADFPQLARYDRTWLTGNGSGMESGTTRLIWTNHEALKKLENYTSESIASKFGEWMGAERDIHVKLLWAAVAAKNGHPGAKKFIQDLNREMDCSITLSRLSALAFLLREGNAEPWVFDEAHRALGDTRRVTGTDRTNWLRGSEYDVSYLAEVLERLPSVLAHAKNPQSVPVLIEMARRTGGRPEFVRALGTMGDPRAIPICLEFLSKWDEANTRAGSGDRFPPQELLSTLGELQATAAAATLLKYVDSPEVVTALGKIGHESAIEPLQQIVSTNGELASDSVRDIGVEGGRVFAARMALIKLQKGEDPIPKWIDIIQDTHLDWTQRIEVTWELMRHPDPRVIMPLVNLVKADQAGELINQCVIVLANYKYKVAVEGLIDCFDADFTGRRAYLRKEINPAGMKGYIGQALQKLTGQDFGADSLAWRKWWNETGRTLVSLQ